MKKICRNVVCIIVVMLLAFGNIVGCARSNPDDGTVEVDTTKTQLYVNNFNAGFGDDWFEMLIDRFEEAYKDTEFEEGKKGVQVIPNQGKYRGVTLIESVKNSRDQVYLTEAVYYYDFLSRGAMLDITDVVTEDLTEYGEDKSIEDKMTASQQDFLKVDGKYYAVPHYEGYYGITFDAELFDQMDLYMGEDGEFDKKSTHSGLSLGVDRQPGTYDDGLPATYEEFYALCAAMLERGVTPIVWSGEYQFYPCCVAMAMAVDANGGESLQTQLNFSGDISRHVDSINPDGTLNTSELTIDSTNMAEVYNQAGYYYVLDFFRTIINNGYCSEDSFLKDFSHTSAQDAFLYSNRDPEAPLVGMIFEGSWWENEAKPTFLKMEDKYVDSSRMDRQFKFMPFPKPDESYFGEKTTIVDYSNAYMFINSNIEEKYIEVAKKFIAFCNTDVSLREFTVDTNTPKALKYKLEESDLNNMSCLGKSIETMRKSEYVDKHYQVSENPFYYNNVSLFALDHKIFECGQYSYPTQEFYNNPDLTAKDYFDLLTAYWKTKINTVVS